MTNEQIISYIKDKFNNYFFGISLINIEIKENYINFKYEIPKLLINNEFTINNIHNYMLRDNDFVDFIYNSLVRNISIDILNYFRYENYGRN